MYMGELVRQVLVDLMKDDLIFVGADRCRWIVGKYQMFIFDAQREAFGTWQLLHPLCFRD